MKTLILTALVMASARLSMLAADRSVTNDNAALTASQTTPMTIMINGPSGRATVPMEFWSDRISTANTNENLEVVFIYCAILNLVMYGHTQEFVLTLGGWIWCI